MTNHHPLPTPLPPSHHLSLTTPPGTDIWRKPPSLDAFNAPIRYRALPLRRFKRARVTVKAAWRTLFDQGGLCLVLPGREGGKRRWVKTGVEFTHGGAHVSTVGCDRWADWSLLPMTGNEATVEMEREIVDGKPTSTLWVYRVEEEEGAERTPLREVTWVFEAEDEGECWVGVYVAKPTRDADDGEAVLRVDFTGLEIETF